jgi:hypothetical protein
MLTAATARIQRWNRSGGGAVRARRHPAAVPIAHPIPPPTADERTEDPPAHRAADDDHRSVTGKRSSPKRVDDRPEKRADDGTTHQTKSRIGPELVGIASERHGDHDRHEPGERTYHRETDGKDVTEQDRDHEQGHHGNPRDPAPVVGELRDHQRDWNITRHRNGRPETLRSSDTPPRRSCHGDAGRPVRNRSAQGSGPTCR